MVCRSNDDVALGGFPGAGGGGDMGAVGAGIDVGNDEGEELPGADGA